jgi:phospholipid/cholesterol/gamma-HCH transport system substrate-binding protein
VIDSGSFAANQLRTFLEANDVELSELIRNLVTTGEVVVENLDGIEQILVLYPYVVEGGFTVVSKSANGLYDAHFGMIMSSTHPCHQGYESTDRRAPQDGSNRPMNENARCLEPAAATNARGAQHAPQRVAATYDQETGELTWADEEALGVDGSLAPRSLGEESWKWLYLQPLTAKP